MATIALFHSVLGVREGVRDAEARLSAAGHSVLVVDQYEGRRFDDYDEASAFAEDLGYPALMARALDGVRELPDGFVPMGFSNGGGMATYVALHRPVAGAVLCSGALPLSLIGASDWPAGVPAQLHYAIGDPFLTEGSVAEVMRSINEAGAVADYVQYPGTGHLFTDSALPAEYDPKLTEAFWSRVLAFLDRIS